MAFGNGSEKVDKCVERLLSLLLLRGCGDVAGED
jgi:hypothetical protein